jgi:hypothetical protein
MLHVLCCTLQRAQTPSQHGEPVRAPLAAAAVGARSIIEIELEAEATADAAAAAAAAELAGGDRQWQGCGSWLQLLRWIAATTVDSAGRSFEGSDAELEAIVPRLHREARP